MYFLFFNDTATTEIYTLSLHDALPICFNPQARRYEQIRAPSPRADARGTEAPSTPKKQASAQRSPPDQARQRDRKSTRLNSSHANISYAVFCLKKKHIIFLAHLSYRLC